MSENIEFKKCSMCGEIKPINNFNKDKSRKDGYYHRCKECNKIYNKKYREEHKEELKEKQKQYYEEHKEECNAKSKQYHQEHREEQNAKNREYYHEHKEECKEYQKNYNKNNKEKVAKRRKAYNDSHKKERSEYNKKYYAENPHKKLNSHQRRRTNKEKTEDITKEQWYEMMMFFDFKCAYSGEYLGGSINEKRTIDHIIPLDKNGYHVIWNLVPCYSNYNFQKKTKDMLEWYLEQPFFSIDRLTKIYEWRIYAYEKWGSEII